MGGVGDFRIRFLSSALVVALAVTSCTPSNGTTRGVVLNVEGDLSEVRSFSLLVRDQRVVDFVPAEGGDFAFPLPHLREHLRTGEPVLVGWEMIDGVRYAVSIRDG